MAITTDLETLIPALCGHESISVASDNEAEVAAVKAFELRLGALSDEQLLAVKDQMLAVHKRWATMMQSMTGIIVARSSREFGHSGLAAKQGHRSAVSLVQEDFGVSKAEATRIVRVAEAVADVAGPAARPDGATSEADREAQAKADQALRDRNDGEGQPCTGSHCPANCNGIDCVPVPWHEPLKAANLAGQLSGPQFSAIMTGLGEPPRIKRDAQGNPVDDNFVPLVIGDEGVVMTGAEADEFDLQVSEAWRRAAVDLVAEAQVRPVNDLLAYARAVRDELDPEGAARRFAERHEARSFRMFQLENGATRAIWTMDDMTALAITAAIDAALRPRRGGPRFVDSQERAAATALSSDPRTNEQLSHDLVSDIFRAGLLADAETVFGTRQACVRLVQVVNQHGERATVAHSEDRLNVVPGIIADQQLCNTGAISVSADSEGNTINLGRTARLFSAKQRIALAIRDGGCRWSNCDRPASYCEAHHIDPWEEGGATDVDRGILLCHYHHLSLHNNHWRITREGKGDFVLTHPKHAPQVLPPRTVLTYAWNQETIPPRRFRPAGGTAPSPGVAVASATGPSPTGPSLDPLPRVGRPSRPSRSVPERTRAVRRNVRHPG